MQAKRIARIFGEVRDSSEETFVFVFRGAFLEMFRQKVEAALSGVAVAPGVGFPRPRSGVVAALSIQPCNVTLPAHRVGVAVARSLVGTRF